MRATVRTEVLVLMSWLPSPQGSSASVILAGSERAAAKVGSYIFTILHATLSRPLQY